MSNRVSVAIIIAAVVGLLYFVVSAVNDFSEASVIRSSGKISAKDSLVFARLDSLQVRDSILTDVIERQRVQIEELTHRLDMNRRNLDVIAKVLSQEE